MRAYKIVQKIYEILISSGTSYTIIDKIISNPTGSLKYPRESYKMALDPSGWISNLRKA